MLILFYIIYGGGGGGGGGATSRFVPFCPALRHFFERDIFWNGTKRNKTRQTRTFLLLKILTSKISSHFTITAQQSYQENNSVIKGGGKRTFG